MKESAIKLLDASLLLAVLTGLFYINGYVYHESYFNNLNVPMRSLELSSQNILIYGAVPISILLFSAALILIAMAFLKVMLPRLSKLPLVGGIFKANDESMPHEYYIGVGLIFCAFILYFFIGWSSSQGKKDAMRFIDGACPLTEVVYSMPPSNQSMNLTTCFIINNAGIGWFRRVSRTGVVEDAAISIPLSEISQMTVVGTLSHYRAEIESLE